MATVTVRNTLIVSKNTTLIYIFAVQQTNFKVGMTCEGCSGAVKRILGKIPGVESIEASVEEKSVVIGHTEAVTREQLNEALQKWSTVR